MLRDEPWPEELPPWAETECDCCGAACTADPRSNEDGCTLCEQCSSKCRTEEE